MKKKDHVLDTERLYLREMTEGDFDALKAVLGDRENMKHYPYLFDEKRIKDWIERNIARYRTFGFGLWAVCLKDTRE
ncbi:MAG: GNAT family N-acetyltransferase, partial [Oscillospiraceae bacterium]|nr:GNAT family N-acetyltransferase [Oscillospiraceae bacterium]